MLDQARIHGGYNPPRKAKKKNQQLQPNECDFKTHECDVNKHKSDFYTQSAISSVILDTKSVISIHMSVTLTLTSVI
jgi:hypothetical protein